MGSFVLETTKEEDEKLQMYALKHKLTGKIEAIKGLIAEINLEIRTSPKPKKIVKKDGSQVSK